jgi:hypothetical protein
MTSTSKLNASATGAGGEIQNLMVEQLAGDLGGVAKLAMPDPIKVTGPLDKPAANGTIKLDGTLDALVPLLAVMNGGAPLPYRGPYTLTQKIGSSQSSEGLAVNLDGSFSAPRFQVLDDAGKTAFEDQVEEKNSIGIYLDKKVATIRALSLSLPRTKRPECGRRRACAELGYGKATQGRKGHLQGQLGRDLEDRLPDDEPRDARELQGPQDRRQIDHTITAGGAFPAKPTVYESMRSLDANGRSASSCSTCRRGRPTRCWTFRSRSRRASSRSSPASPVHARRRPRTATTARPMAAAWPACWVAGRRSGMRRRARQQPFRWQGPRRHRRN